MTKNVGFTAADSIKFSSIFSQEVRTNKAVLTCKITMLQTRSQQNNLNFPPTAFVIHLECNKKTPNLEHTLESALIN